MYVFQTLFLISTKKPSVKKMSASKVEYLNMPLHCEKCQKSYWSLSKEAHFKVWHQDKSAPSVTEELAKKLTVIMRKKVKEKSAPGDPSDSWQSQKASRETRNAVRTLSRKSHRTKRCQLPCRRWTMASLWTLCKQDIQTWSTPPTALRLTLSLLQTSPSQEQTSNLARWVTFSSKLSFCQIYWNKMKKTKQNKKTLQDALTLPWWRGFPPTERHISQTKNCLPPLARFLKLI